MVRVCPKRDTACPHGNNCPYVINRYQCKPEKPEAPLMNSMDEPKTYRTFDEWWSEIEGFSTRAERAYSELGPHALEWLMTAYSVGASSQSTQKGSE